MRAALLRGAYAAQRELERRAVDHRFGGPSLEEWLRFLIRHEETVGRAAADDARALIVGRYGVHVWDALLEVGAGDAIDTCYETAIDELLALQRNGMWNPWTSRTIRRVAFRVLFEPTHLDEGQGEA